MVIGLILEKNQGRIVSKQTWANLDGGDIRHMLTSLIGGRFGDRPEEHLDEIREERSRYASNFIRMARIKPSHTVLDIGSGCGFGTAAIARHARQVIACDISPAYLEFARRECSELENVHFKQITSRDLSPVKDDSVDAVISMAVFIHLNIYDIYYYFQEFNRVLRPGGNVLIDFANMNRLFGWPPNRGQDQQFLTQAGFYHDDHTDLPHLIQWNTARGIKGVARSAGFKFCKRRGHKLLFSRKLS